jgi:flagellar biosynthesis protein FliR
VTGTLAALLSESQGAAILGFVVFLRVGAVMALLPAFGEMAVPVRVRLGLALAFTAVVAPAVAMGLALPPVWDAAALPLLAGEVLTGLTLGVGFRLFVMALMTAGTMVAQATSLAQVFAGAGAEPMPAVGHMLVTGGLALATLGGLHVLVAEALIGSYAALPFGSVLSGATALDWGTAQIARAFSLAFALAMPFLAASLLYNVALGVINRAMPHLSVAFVGAPAITLGALALMMVSVPLGLSVWSEALQGFLADPFAAPVP